VGGCPVVVGMSIYGKGVARPSMRGGGPRNEGDKEELEAQPLRSRGRRVQVCSLGQMGGDFTVYKKRFIFAFGRWCDDK